MLRCRLPFINNIPAPPTMFRACVAGLGTIAIFCEKARNCCITAAAPLNGDKLSGVLNAAAVSRVTYEFVKSPNVPPKTFLDLSPSIVGDTTSSEPSFTYRPSPATTDTASFTAFLSTPAPFDNLSASNCSGVSLEALSASKANRSAVLAPRFRSDSNRPFMRLTYCSCVTFFFEIPSTPMP